MKSRHIMVLIAMCGLAAASIGVTVNTAGVFYAPIAEDLGVGRGSVAMSVTILSITASIVAMTIPKLMKESNLKLLIITAVALLCGATLAHSVCNALWQIYALSIIRGIGDGMINFVLITTILNYWFYAKHGLITSIVMAFSGVPGVILSPIYSGTIASSGWRAGYVVVAISTLAFCLPAILFPISIRPEKAGLKPYGYEEFEKMRAEGKTFAIESGSPVFNWFNPKFMLAVVFTIMASTIAAVPQHFPGYATSIGYGAEVGALMLSVSMAFNIGAKLLFGVLSDKLGSYKAVMTMAIVNTLSILLLIFFVQQFALYVGAGMYAFVFAIGAVGIAMITGYLFGMDHYGTVYPVLSFVGGVANAIGGTLVGSLYDMTGSYAVNFWFALACELILMITLTAACRIRRKERHTGIELD